jgi:hypothetical protein
MAKTMGADLTDDEIDRICDGLSQNAAKVKFLRGLGLRVERKPNGRPLVNRKHYDDVTGSAAHNGRPARSDGPSWSVQR